MSGTCSHKLPSKTFCGVLPDKRFYDRECLTGTGSSDNPCSSEWIDYIYPSFAKFSFVVVTHRNIDRVFVFYLLFHLRKLSFSKLNRSFNNPSFKNLEMLSNATWQRMAPTILIRKYIHVLRGNEKNEGDHRCLKTHMDKNIRIKPKEMG